MVWQLQGDAVPLETRWPRVWEAEREVQSSSWARAALLYTLGSCCTRVSLEHRRNTAWADQGSDAHCLGTHADGTQRVSGRRRRLDGAEEAALHNALERV